MKPLVITLLLAAALVTQPGHAGQTEIQGYFGAQLGPGEDGSVELVTVLPGSPAEQAGFETGDTLLRIGELAAVTPDQAAAVLRNLGIDQEVIVEFSRAGSSRESTLRLGKNPWQDADRPDPTYADVQIIKDIDYGTGESSPRHRLDLYLPRTESPAPALLWVHGGGWSFGEKASERALALRFAERGVAMAVMNYRLSSGRWADEDAPAEGVSHPEHVNDVARAFDWLHRNSGDLGLDANRLYAGGHSAGAHLTALLATDPTFLAAYGLPVSVIAGVVPIGGAYDIPHYHDALVAGEPAMGKAHITSVFGPTREDWTRASPTQYLHLSNVPMHVVVEEQAGFQSYAQRLKDAALRAERDNIQFHDALGRTHGNVLLMMSGRHEDDVRAGVIAFIQRSAQRPG